MNAFGRVTDRRRAMRRHDDDQDDAAALVERAWLDCREASELKAGRTHRERLKSQ
jgi:hypothetical protein